MEHPLSFRADDMLLKALEGFATTHGMSRSAVISRLLAEALGQPTADPVEARLDALEARVAELEQRPQAEPTEGERYPGLAPGQYLGTLCHNNHDWRGTGKSRRKKSSDSCMDCERERKLAKKAAAQVLPQ